MHAPSHVLMVPIDDLGQEEVAELSSRVTELLARFRGSESGAVRGWTADLAAQLFRRLLAANRPAQTSVLIAEAQTNGRCDRETVYRIGHYNSNRSLTGFTKPVSRIMREMQEEGILPVDAAHPMTPIYDAQNPSFQRAQGFQMPEELVPVFASAVSLREGAQTP